ncbi:MAG: hypothetical protein Q8N83_17255 [Ignavibacteria bacterium]|nr:hypothetical protein [Ignavibacteria bacterium]
MSSLKSSCLISFFGVLLLGFFFSSGIQTNAQTKLRIGVFDSRAVAVAFYNSKFSTNQQIFASLGTRMKEAKEKDDKDAIAKIEREASLRQVMMHEQGFGRGSINNVTGAIKDKLAQLAKSENLSVIVSKWELVFSSADVVSIDVTEKIVDFFEPNEKIKSMMKEIMESEPLKDAFLIND